MASGEARRGRPRRSEAAETALRAKVIAMARDLFAHDGYEGVSMRRVAEQAGCSAAQLYTLFGGKRALLRHIWEDAFAELGEALGQAARDEDPVLRLKALGRAWCAFWVANPDHYRAIFLIEDRVSEPGERYFVETSESLSALDSVRDAVREAMAAGRLAGGDPEAAAQLLLCGLQGVVFNLITIPEYPWVERETLGARMADALIAGLGATEGSAPRI